MRSRKPESACVPASVQAKPAPPIGLKPLMERSPQDPRVLRHRPNGLPASIRRTTLFQRFRKNPRRNDRAGPDGSPSSPQSPEARKPRSNCANKSALSWREVNCAPRRRPHAPPPACRRPSRDEFQKIVKDAILCRTALVSASFRPLTSRDNVYTHPTWTRNPSTSSPAGNACAPPRAGGAENSPALSKRRCEGRASAAPSSPYWRC